MNRPGGRGSASVAIVTSGATPHRMLAAAIMARAVEDARGDIAAFDRQPHELDQRYAMRKQAVIDDAKRWLREDAHVWCALMEQPDTWQELLEAA